MTRKNIMSVGIVIISVLIIIGILLLLWVHFTDSDRNVIRVGLDMDESVPVDFEKLKLVPGESCEYTLSFSGKDSKRYDLALNFNETEKGSLRNYAKVKLVSGDEIIYDEYLKDAFDGDPVALHVDFSKKLNTKLLVIFYMPIEIGNEAMGAEVYFNLLVSATK